MAPGVEGSSPSVHPTRDFRLAIDDLRLGVGTTIVNLQSTIVNSLGEGARSSVG